MAVDQNIEVDTNAGYSGLGAYTAASNANVAAGGSAFTGAETIGKWLPYLGYGLSAYNLLTAENPMEGSVALLGGASTAALAGDYALGGALAAPALVALGINLFAWKKPKAPKPEVVWHNPELRVIYTDEEGNYYLWDESENRGNLAHTVLRYNPETNKLEQCKNRVDIDTGYIEGSYNPNPVALNHEYWGAPINVDTPEDELTVLLHNEGRVDENGNYYYHTGAYDRDFTDEEEAAIPGILERMEWTEVDPSKPLEGEWKSPPEAAAHSSHGYEYVAGTLYNMSSLQAQIYNQVLLPGGYASSSGWEPITLDGKRFWTTDGVIVRSNGEIVAYIDPETDEVRSFHWGEHSLINIEDGSIEPPPSFESVNEYVTPIYAEDAKKNPAFIDSEDYHQEIGIGGFGTVPDTQFSVRNIQEDTRGGTLADWDKWWLDNYGLTYAEKSLDKNYGKKEIKEGRKKFEKWKQTQTGDAPYTNLLHYGHSQGQLYYDDQLVGYVDTRTGGAYDLNNQFLGQLSDPNSENDTGLSPNYQAGDSLSFDFGFPQSEWHLQHYGPEWLEEFYGTSTVSTPDTFSYVSDQPSFTASDQPSSYVPVSPSPTAHITLPGPSGGLLDTSDTSDISDISDTSGQEQSPFDTQGTWDPTATSPSMDDDSAPAPPDDGNGLLSPTIPSVAHITLPQRGIESTGLLSGNTAELEQNEGGVSSDKKIIQEQSPFDTPGTWDPTATWVKSTIPVPPGTRR